MTTKPKPADNYLKHHHPWCKMNVFSLQAERTCTCGRDDLVKELEELRAIAQTVKPVQIEMVMR